MANSDTLKIASEFTAEYEGGKRNVSTGESLYNEKTGQWTAYDDPLVPGKTTVGPGLTGNIGDEPIQIGKEYSSEDVSKEYSKRLSVDLKRLSDNVEGWGNLNPNQQASVMSLVHNVGFDAFSKSDAYQHLSSGNFKEFLKEAFDPEVGFVKAGGEVVEGLQTRRAAERNLFESSYKTKDTEKQEVGDRGIEDKLINEWSASNSIG